MEKIFNFMIQTVAYFIIVLLIFFIAQKLGVMSDVSIWPFAIGSTIGWVIVQGVSILLKKNTTK